MFSDSLSLTSSFCVWLLSLLLSVVNSAVIPGVLFIPFWFIIVSVNAHTAAHAAKLAIAGYRVLILVLVLVLVFVDSGLTIICSFSIFSHTLSGALISFACFNKFSTVLFFIITHSFFPEIAFHLLNGIAIFVANSSIWDF